MGFIKKRLKGLDKPGFLSNLKFQILLPLFILFAIMRVTYTFDLYDFKYDYKIGDVVTEDIIMPEDYIDSLATSVLKENVRYETKEIYTIDPSVYGQAREEIADFYRRAYETRLEYVEDQAILERVFAYVLRSSMGLTEDELKFLAGLDEADLKLSENYVYDALQEVLKDGVTDENMIKQKQSVDLYMASIDQVPEDLIPIMTKMVKHHVAVNSLLDEEATDALIIRKLADIEDVIIPKGTVVLKAGQTLDQTTYDILETYNLNNLHNWRQKLPLFSMDLLVLVVLYVMYKVLYAYHGKRLKLLTSKNIYLNFTIVGVLYLLTYIGQGISSYLLLLPTVAMLISILNNATQGIVYSVFVNVLLAVTMSWQLDVLVFSMMASLAAALLVDRVYQRGKIFLSGLAVGFIFVLMILAISLVDQLSFKESLNHMTYGFVSGLLCSVITIGSLPLWESLFKILTPLKLLEYANPNHPLMKKMLLEAPGTYHHSILVANLAEAAAHDIGANAFLTRVGAYFHDIGKLEKPYFYVENQYDGLNPHDQFVPMVSAKIIKDHVSGGVKLAKKHKLPKEIIEFISQHHGTTRIQYFYHKALNAQGDDEVDVSLYTYQGPEPFNREIAIVMLADSVEAGVRSLKKPGQDQIEDLIHRIIQSKIEMRQLNASGLTLDEIDRIQKSFSSNLTTAFHDRIEYPSEKKDTEVRRVK